MSARWQPTGPVGRAVNSIEESLIALFLGLMVILTFVNVVLRKLSGWAWLREQEKLRGFDIPDSIIWSLEVVLILFAWLVILGVSYGFKVTANLGVDALTNALPERGRRVAALTAGVVCLAYAALLLKGAWDYWAPYAALDRTSGAWFPTGFENTRDQAWFVTDQVPMPGVLRFLEDLINQGEEYEKLPRVVPYAILPFGAALILLRVVQSFVAVVRGRRDSLIVSHEAEEAVEEAAAAHAAPAAATPAGDAVATGADPYETSHTPPGHRPPGAPAPLGKG